MKKALTLNLKKQKRNGVFYILFFLSLIFSSCNSSTPQRIVLGTWLRDAGCQYGSSADKLVIESNGEGLYEITLFEPPVTGYPPQRKVSGVFKNERGKPMVEVRAPGYGDSYIEIFPEAKKIDYDGCHYSKQ